MTTMTAAALRAQLFQVRTSRMPISYRVVGHTRLLADTEREAVNEGRKMVKAGEFERVRVVPVVGRDGNVFGHYIIGRRPKVVA